MEILKKLNSTSTTMTPYTIRSLYFDDNGNEKEDFTLKPPYQRNVVWDIKQYLKFIESVFCGIVPGPIILSIDSINNKKTCVDGKQRLTSIIKFFRNEIPYCKILENTIELYWFKEEKEDNSIYKILTEIYQIDKFKNKLITSKMKCWIENEVQITIVQYIDITYEQQIDIFNRLQYGMTISRGSYLKSFIQDAKLCEHIINTSNKYNRYFDKYVKNTNNDDQIKLMTEIFLILEYNYKTTIKNEKVDFELKKMTMKSFQKLDRRYENLIKIMYELLNINEFKHKKVIIQCLLFAKEKMKLDEFDEEIMKNVLEKLYIEITKEKKQFKSADDIYKFIEENWNVKIQKNLKISSKIEIANNKKNKSKIVKNYLSESESDSESDFNNDDDDDDNDNEKIN